ncbi:MAG TPA: nucleotide exchange factor GrpE [Nitrososphaeraceae archaeon]|jgi:molecular chaperone GrpE|nr:nucleotide exchange factor GrpE [Nitrososphaeraceae archaeon]
MEEEYNGVKKEVEAKEPENTDEDELVSSEEEIPQIKRELTLVREELNRTRESYNNTLNKLKYLMADFDNYRKQMEKQVSSKIESGRAELLIKFLNIHDEFLQALKMAKQSKSENVVIEGLDAILKNFDYLIKSEGLMEIETIGTPFDPNVHDAISSSKRDDIPNNTVTNEIRKGYMLNNKVLRPSLVEISKKIVKNTINDTEKVEKESEN